MPAAHSASGPLVSIVVVSYNATPYLRRCLESLRSRTRPSHEIIVVDNASGEETRDYLRSLDFIRRILNDENRLWCAGCSQGIAEASPASRYFLLLNPDVEALRDDWLDRLLQVARSGPRVGLVGTKLQYRPVAPLFGFLDGQCLLVARALLEEVGGLAHERFPWSGAPQLLAAQAYRRGWALRHVHPSERLVLHHNGRSRAEYAGTLPRHSQSTLAALMREEGLEPRAVPRWRRWLESRFPKWRNRRLHFCVPPMWRSPGNGEMEEMSSGSLRTLPPFPHVPISSGEPR